LALLVEQLAFATHELRSREAEGGRVEEMRVAIRTLRRTLASVAMHGSVKDLSRSEFSVKCPAPKEMELWHRGRKLPVNARVFRDPLEAAGVELQPGQVLLADREWAREMVEESLAALSLEELRIRDGKDVLMRTLQDNPPPSTHLS
jgi:hypothetical protein